jgi:hypothetical protein
VITLDSLANGRFVYFPDNTPGDIGASFTYCDRRGSEVTLNCALCGVEYLVRVDESNTVLPEHVRTLAGHLWRIHSLPVLAAAEGRG